MGCKLHVIKMRAVVIRGYPNSSMMPAEGQNRGRGGLPFLGVIPCDSSMPRGLKNEMDGV